MLGLTLKPTLKRTRKNAALLAVPALLLAPLMTGCATSAAPRTSIAPSWSYHDTPDPMAYSEVWGRPAEMGDVQVVSVDEPLR